MQLRAPLGLRNAIGVSAIVALIAAGSGVAHAAAQFTVSYTLVEEEVSPRRMTYRRPFHFTITMFKDGSLLTPSGVRYLGKDTEAVEPRTGAHYKISYRVRDGAILIVAMFPGLLDFRRITTNQKDQCTATIEYQPIPGRRDFEDIRMGTLEHVTLKAMRAEGLTCVISEVPE